jgi:hypothetical protein
MAVFWVVAPSSLVEVYQRFRGACCIITVMNLTSLMTEAASICSYNPEDGHLQTVKMLDMGD